MNQLKDISELKNWERILSKKVNGVSLLGEISFNKSQFKKLEENIINKNIDLSTIINKYPTPLAFYLVQAGIYYYENGEYWPNLKIAQDKSIPYLSQKLSTFFENYLEENGLISLGLSGPYSTIDDILIHGFVPNSDLSKYFDFAEKANRDSTTPEELTLELNLFREKEKEYKALENKQNEIDKRSAVYNLMLQSWEDIGILIEADQGTVNNQETAVLCEELVELLDDLENIENRYKSCKKFKTKEDKNIEKLQERMFSRSLKRQELLYLQNHSVSDLYNLFSAQEVTKGLWGKIIDSILNFIPFFEFSRPSVNSLSKNPPEYPFRGNYLDTNTDDLVSHLVSYRESLITTKKVSAEMEELKHKKQKIDTRLQQLSVELNLESNEPSALYKLAQDKIREFLANEERNMRINKLVEQEDFSQEELMKEYKNLIKLGKDKGFVNEELQRLKKESEFIKHEKETIHPRLNIYLPPSIRNFLLFGKKPAQEFYQSTIKLINGLENNRFPPEIDLPLRITSFAKDWWNQKEKSMAESKKEVREKKILSANPYLVFDKNSQQIFLNFPSQSFVKVKPNVQLKLNGETVKEQLRLYNVKGDSIETESLEDILIEKPSSQYKVEITTGEKTLDNWIIGALTHKLSFIAFDYHTGRQVPVDKLTQKKTWLIYDRRITLEKENSIQADGYLTGAWRNFKYALVDLGDSQEIAFRTKEGDLQKFPITQTKIEFELSPLFPNYTRLSSNGNKVYTHTFPELKIINPDNLSNYYIFSQNLENDLTAEPTSFEKLQNKFIKDEQNYRLDISNLFNQEKKLLAGTYLIKIKGYFPQQNHLEEFIFSYIPGLEIQFNQDIYPPAENPEDEIIQLKIKPPYGMAIQELNENNRERKDDFTRFSLSYDETPFYTELKTKENKVLLLKIMKPVLTWQLTNNKNLDWTNRSQVSIREIWYEDYFKSKNGNLLKIRFPQSKTDRIWLELRKEKHKKIPDRSFENLFEFNLSEFNDTLRQSKNTRSTFLLKTYNREKDETLEFPLFRIRHKWEADLTLLTKKVIKDKLHLSLEYEEKGEAEKPVLILWSISNTNNPKKIGEYELTGKKSLELIEKVRKITPGNYRIHFIDKRVTDEDFPASLDILNTYDFEIEPEELEELAPGTKLTLRSALSDRGIRYPLNKNTYVVEIIGKILDIKREQEDYEEVFFKDVNVGMYLANIRMLSLKFVPRIDKELQKINPVKIEYERGTIRTIEEKKGAGHTYCPHCEKFYYEQRDIAKLGEPKNHINAINRCYYQFETKFA